MVLSVFRKTQRNRRLSPDDDSDVVDNPLGFVLKKKKKKLNYSEWVVFIPNGHLLGYK